MASEAWTVRRLLEWTEDFLRKKGFESPRLEAQILLAHALGCNKIDLYVRHTEEPPESKRTAFREMIKKRSEGMPVAYLVGYREFYSLAFAVSPAVLIPRPETETLVMQSLSVLKAIPSPRVLDIGTGSGCVAISIAKQHKTALVTAVDASADAVQVATANAVKHGVADRVTILPGDLFDPVAGQTFDLIVSNPPYIGHEEFAGLDKGVRDFEPRQALDGGVDGLDFYRRIAMSAAAHLAPGGAIFVEIGQTQGPAVEALLTTHVGPGKTYVDMSGRPRVVSAKRPL